MSGIVINKSYGLGGIHLTPDMVEFIQSKHPNWSKPKDEIQLRTDPVLIQTLVKYPDEFIVRCNKTHFNRETMKNETITTYTKELHVSYVAPEVIEAKAWVITTYDGCELVTVVPERMLLFKIRQITKDPEILKLTEFEVDHHGFMS